jgi:hypothetical protein
MLFLLRLTCCFFLRVSARFLGEQERIKGLEMYGEEVGALAGSCGAAVGVGGVGRAPGASVVAADWVFDFDYFGS